MLKSITFTILILLCAAFFSGCAGGRMGVEKSGTAHSAETEQESALSAAKAAAADNDTSDGDIIIVYDKIIMAASCYRVENGEVVLLYDGDYQGSYDNLDCIADGEYNDWDVLIYRTKTVAETHSTQELDELAQTVLRSYTERYGELKAGSFICLTEPDGSVYQYVSLTEGGVEYIDETDHRYNAWESSEQADNYWAKYVHDDKNETSWAVYEYDVQCSKAFEKIADMTDCMGDVENGTVFMCELKEKTVLMRYEDGAVYYVQGYDWGYMEDGYTLLDTSDIKNAPENVKVYVPKD